MKPCWVVPLKKEQTGCREEELWWLGSTTLVPSSLQVGLSQWQRSLGHFPLCLLLGDGVRLCQTAQLWVNRAFIFIKAAIPTQGFFGHCRVSPGLLADLA